MVRRLRLRRMAVKEGVEVRGQSMGAAMDGAASGGREERQAACPPAAKSLKISV